MSMFTFIQPRPRSRGLSRLTNSDFSGRNSTRPAHRSGMLRLKAGSGEGPAPLFDPALRSKLRQRLLALPYRAFLQTVVHLLSAQGYQAVAPAGRAHFKGRNTSGGWDLEARYAADEAGPRLCVARVKQFGTQPVDLRYVDELRGAALRAGASEALLVTLSTFSKPSRLASLSGPVPVRLVDGEALLDDLLGQEIGVRRAAGNTAESRKSERRKSERRKAGEWEVDDTYFELLERRFAEQRAGEQRPADDEVAARRSGDGTAQGMNRTEATTSSTPPARPVRTALAQAGEPFQAVWVTITVTRSQNDPGRTR